MLDGQENSEHDNTDAKDQSAEESTNTNTDENQNEGDGGQPAEQSESEDKGEDSEGESESTDKDDEKPVEYDLKAPEGVDEEALKEFTEKAKELELSNDQAQAMLDMKAEQQKTFQDELQQSWETKVEEWGQEVRKDKELGGDKFETTMHNVSRAMDKFSTPEFKKALEESGWGNHPDLVRVFNNIGKAMGEDTHIDGERSQGEKSLADRIYGKQES